MVDHFLIAWHKEIIIGLVTFILLLLLIIRREFRIFRNLKRKIYFIQTGDDNLQIERSMFSTNKLLFKIHNEPLKLQDENVLQIITKKSMILVGYSPDFQNYKRIVDIAINTNSGLVVYAKPHIRISEEHINIFQSHLYWVMCQTKGRLLSDVFNSSIVTP